MLPWLYEHIPEHTTLVDGCGGSGAFLLGREPSPVEVYNDIDHGLTTFFKICRDQPEELAAQMLLTPYSRIEFDECKANIEEPGQTDVEIARRFATVARMSINGLWGKSWSRAIAHCRRKMSSSVSRWLHLPDDIVAIAARMASVQIEELDWVELFKSYDREATFFYFDPPYPTDVRSPDSYVQEMTIEQHEEMLKLVLDVKGMVMFSSYRNALYDKMLEGWIVVERKVMCRSNVQTTGKKGKRPDRTEALYMNYEIV